MGVQNRFSPNTKALSAEVNENFDDLAKNENNVYEFDKARVTKSGSQSINNNIETTLTWDQEDFDTATLHDNVTNNERLTCQKTGWYFISINVNFTGANGGTGARYISIVKNGSTPIATASLLAASGGVGESTDKALTVSTIYYMTAGEYVIATALQNTGGALNILSARSHFDMAMMP